jgi:hypothetical protein
MATTIQKNRILMVFHHETDDELVTTMGAVGTAVFGHSDRFPAPAVDKATFNTQTNALSAAVVAAKDGGRKAVAEKSKQRTLSTKMLSKLARYVQEVANNDLTILTLSGFAVNSGPSLPQPLEHTTLEKLEQAASGEIHAKPKHIRGARMFEARAGVAGPGGAAPSTWTTLQMATSKSGVLFKGLTPGALYVFQVRAFGKLGWTEWSDSVTKMST